MTEMWKKDGKMDMTPQIRTKIGTWMEMMINWGQSDVFFDGRCWGVVLLGQFFCRNMVGKLEMAPVMSFLSSLTTPAVG